MLAFSRRTICTGLVSTLLVAGCGSKSDGESNAGADGGPPKYTAFPMQSNAYSPGDPSDLEQGLLELMQRARANPAAEGPLLVNGDDSDVSSDLTYFMVDKQQVIADFKTYMPVPPLVINGDLMASSRVHSLDMATVGFQTHDGSKGETFETRITNSGYKWSFIAENIFSYARSIVEMHVAFLVDWGNPDLGHRDAYLDLDGAKRDVGISIIQMNGPNSVGPLIVTEDFGMPLDVTQRFLVGVVYSDTNKNGLYDPMEGLAGYNIVPNSGETYGFSSTSGGYAIPFPANAGALEVQVQGPDGIVLDQKSATFKGDNVKVDFVLSM